jgi:translation initiation factor IF-1
MARKGLENSPLFRQKSTNRKFMDKHIELEGIILAVLAGTAFRVQINHTRQVLACVSGRLRRSFVRLGIGDRVKLQMSPYDLDKARIMFRLG